MRMSKIRNLLIYGLITFSVILIDIFFFKAQVAAALFLIVIMVASVLNFKKKRNKATLHLVIVFVCVYGIETLVSNHIDKLIEEKALNYISELVSDTKLNKATSMRYLNYTISYIPPHEAKKIGEVVYEQFSYKRGVIDLETGQIRKYKSD